MSELYFNNRISIGLLLFSLYSMIRDEFINNLENTILGAGYSVQYSSLCTRYASRLIENGLPVVFDIKHLSLLIGIAEKDLLKMLFDESRYYSSARIPKKTGGVREICIPSVDLKYIQRWILSNILSRINTSCHAYGFKPNRSIVDNARLHLHKHCIVNIDLHDFFPSISFNMVFRIFSYYGYTREVSFALAKLCTYKGILPQGSPASPYISNICCLKLDARLAALSEKYEAAYSRYADDLTFSGIHDIKSIVMPVTAIVADEGFSVNEKKTRIAFSHQRQEVTGLIVNGNHVSIPKEYKRKLQQEIYYCTKFGVQDHLKRINCDRLFYKEHLYGKIYFVNMVEPECAERLFYLADQIKWDY